jgi:hypothetical protein
LTKFTENHRSALTRMFRNMTAHSMSWDILWEVCLELNEDSVAKAMEYMDGIVEPFEAISITSSLRKAGFNHIIRSWKEV